MAERRTQAERTATTRAALLRSARQLYAERGIAETGREDIAELAGVTRGALYHHFSSTKAVAVAVIEQIDDELVDRVVRAARGTDDPAEQIRRSGWAYVAAAAEPDIARIVREAPLVLSPAELRAANDATCLRLLEPVLRRLGLDGDVGITARLLLGLFDEAALLVAEDPKRKRRVLASLDALLDGLIGV